MRYTRLLALVSEVTGVMSAPLGYVVMLAGFCLSRPGATGLLTLGFMEDRGLCSYIHLGSATVVLGLMLVVHGVASMMMLVDKYASRRLASFLHPLIAGLGVVVGGQMLIIWLS